MRTLLFICITCLFLSPLVRANSLLIKGVYIIDENAVRSEAPVNVLIKDGDIHAIGSKPYRAKRTIDATGQYLIPGLIDTHVHLRGVPGLEPKTPKQEEIYNQALQQIPKSYLYFGFTTVLDIASTPQFTKEWNSQALAPHAEFCHAATIPHAYPFAMSLKDPFNTYFSRHFLHDPKQDIPYPKTFKPEEHTPKQIAKYAAEDGAICIKAYFERGFGPKKGLPVPSLAVMASLVKSANDHKLPVFLHASSSEAYQFGLDIGISAFAHGLWHGNSHQATQHAKAMKKHNISVQPTLTVLQGEIELFDPNFFKRETTRHAIPQKLIQWYQTEAGQWMRNIIAQGEPTRYETIRKNYSPIVAKHRTNTKIFERENINLIFGSDTPSGPMYTQFPGLNGYKEMLIWHEIGIDLKKIFLALTYNNAKFLGLEKQIGAIKKNMQADLLLLNKNPLKDITAYNAINTVILDGMPIKREQLSAQ